MPAYAGVLVKQLLPQGAVGLALRLGSPTFGPILVRIQRVLNQYLKIYSRQQGR